MSFNSETSKTPRVIMAKTSFTFNISTHIRFNRDFYFIFVFQTVGISLMFCGIPLMLCGLFSREVKSYACTVNQIKIWGAVKWLQKLLH